MAALPEPSRELAEEVLREAERQQRRAEHATGRTIPSDLSSMIPKRADLGTKPALCPDHGAFQSIGLGFGRVVRWSRCPGCQAADDERERAERASAEVARQREARERLIGEADIPARFRSRTFASFVADTDAKRKALEVATAYAGQFDEAMQRGSGLVFAGLPGTGKSHLAASILLALVDNRAVRYTTCMGLIRMIRDTWRRDSEISERAVLRMLCDDIDLLVIDEVGVQYGTDGEQTILFEVLDRRYSGMRPTILLTNQDRDGFKSFVGDRVFDRLRETSRWVAFDWPSYRGTARAAA